MTEGSRNSRDVSSLSFVEDSASLGAAFSTITNVPPSIDVIVPQPPPTEPPTLEGQETIDSRFVMKIVQERLAHHHENQDVTRDTSSRVDSHSNGVLTLSSGDISMQESATTSPLHQASVPQMEDSTTSPSYHPQQTPGAVRVSGIYSRSTLGGSVNTRDLEASAESTSAPFEPEVPVEAQLVDDSNSSNEVVQAQPVGSNSIKFKDVLENRKICCSFAAILVAFIILAVGLSLGLTNSSNAAPKDSDSTPIPTPAPSPQPPIATDAPANNTNTTHIQTTIQTPFSNKLLNISIEIIVTDSTSPQYMANQWMWGDPNRTQYDVSRSLARFALATIYFATRGDHWHRNDNWLSYEVHECDWYMPHPNDTCNEDGNYVIVNLTSNALNGTAATHELLMYLSQVHTLDVSNNTLSGSPPPLVFGQFPGLRHLDYSNNNLKGTISAEIGWSNQNLQVLRLFNNQLSGSIPGNLYSVLPVAEDIDLSGNQFIGTVPGTFLRNNTKVRRLNLGDNLLQFTVPSSLQYLLELELLDVSGNVAITGTIPNELSTCTDLKVLDIEDTSLTGSIPTGLCILQASEQLQLIADCSEELQCCPCCP